MRFAREITALVAAPAAIWITGWGPVWLFNATMALAFFGDYFRLFITFDKHIYSNNFFIFGFF